MADKKEIGVPVTNGSEGGGVERKNRSGPNAEISAQQTEEYLRQPSERGNVAEAKLVLWKAGRGRQPEPGDKL